MIALQQQVIAYWLIPAKAQRELFRAIIRILARQTGGPQFEPHVTIFVATNAKKSPREILPQINILPVRLRVDGMGVSGAFTKTLFVRLHPERALDDLSLALARLTRSRRKPVRDPHLSLLYKKLPARAKGELAAMVKLPFRSVQFDSIKAVRCALPTRTASEVERWKVLATKSLR